MGIDAGICVEDILAYPIWFVRKNRQGCGAGPGSFEILSINQGYPVGSGSQLRCQSEKIPQLSSNTLRA